MKYVFFLMKYGGFPINFYGTHHRFSFQPIHWWWFFPRQATSPTGRWWLPRALILPWWPFVARPWIFRCLRWRFHEYGYGSIPINTIFRGMNIHLPAILMFTRGTRFWHTAISSINLNHDFEIWDLTFDIGWCYFMLFLYLIWVLWRDWVKLFISMKLDG